MIIVMQAKAEQTAIDNVVKLIRSRGLSEHISYGQECTIIGAVGDERVFSPAELERLPQVEKAFRILDNWRIISREARAENTVFSVRGVLFGEGILHALALSENPNHENARALLSDPFFISDNPYADYQRQDEKKLHYALQQQSEQCHQNGQILMVRIRDSRHIATALNADADVLYLGGEMMVNRAILQEVGRLNVPVVLCKDKHHSVRDWLTAAEQVVLQGNQHLILGEAGTMNLGSNHLRLDCDAIVQAKMVSHLPVLADVSRLYHRHMPREVLCRLAQAAGADIIVS